MGLLVVISANVAESGLGVLLIGECLTQLMKVFHENMKFMAQIKMRYLKNTFI